MSQRRRLHRPLISSHFRQSGSPASTSKRGKRRKEDGRYQPLPTFKIMWRDKFQAETSSLNHGKLRVATQLTGHAGVDYHLHKHKPHIITKACPFCQCGDETVSPYLVSGPRWARLRAPYLNTHYDSLSTII